MRNDYIVLQYPNMELYIAVEKITLWKNTRAGRESFEAPASARAVGTQEKENQEKLESFYRTFSLCRPEEQLRGFKYPPTANIRNFSKAIFREEAPTSQSGRRNKKDMEARKIVDRLICANMGYGKTEIAMRIAFKTVYSGKQVYIWRRRPFLRASISSASRKGLKNTESSQLTDQLVPKKEKELVADFGKGMVDILISAPHPEQRRQGKGFRVVNRRRGTAVRVVHKKNQTPESKHATCSRWQRSDPGLFRDGNRGPQATKPDRNPPKDRYPNLCAWENDIVIKEAVYREIARQPSLLSSQQNRRPRQSTSETAFVGSTNRRRPWQMTKNQLEDAVRPSSTASATSCSVRRSWNGNRHSNTNTLIIDEAEYLGLSQICKSVGVWVEPTGWLTPIWCTGKTGSDRRSRETPFRNQRIHQPRFRLQNSRARSCHPRRWRHSGRNNPVSSIRSGSICTWNCWANHQQGPQQSAPGRKTRFDQCFQTCWRILCQRWRNKNLNSRNSQSQKQEKRRVIRINRPLWKAQRRNPYIEEISAEPA